MRSIARLAALTLALALSYSVAVPATAALTKYKLNFRTQLNDPDVSPNPDRGEPPPVYREDSVAVIDAAAGPNPRLRKLVQAIDQTVTVDVPALNLQIFVSSRAREGPDVANQVHGNPVAVFTGTGNTNGGSTIRWGTVTGWSLTSSTWCRSSPAVVCSLAMLMNQDTVDGRFNSTSYDLGTWIFHGTGFTVIPFIRSYSSISAGNTTFYIRGFRNPDGTVPVLPLLGIATLGASLVAGGVVALRRGRTH
jgi:hypothetical protein